MYVNTHEHTILYQHEMYNFSIFLQSSAGESPQRDVYCSIYGSSPCLPPQQLLTSGIPKYSASTILSLFSLSAANK